MALPAANAVYLQSQPRQKVVVNCFTRSGPGIYTPVGAGAGRGTLRTGSRGHVVDITCREPAESTSGSKYPAGIHGGVAIRGLADILHIRAADNEVQVAVGCSHVEFCDEV